MKKTLFCLGASIVFLSFYCTKVEFNNPIDPKGSNFQGDSATFDDDGDGIANFFDLDWKKLKDKFPPVITFNGGFGPNKDTVIFRQGDPTNILATTATVTAADTGAITSQPVTITNSGIFTSQCGVQSVTYTATDAAGNSSNKSRVIIVDCDPPVITLTGDNPVQLKVGQTYTEPGATANDNVDGPVPVTMTGTVATNKETVDSIIYTATDRAGNVARKKRTVVVSEEADKEPPVITLKGSNPLMILAGTPYEEPGWTVTDNRDTDLQNKVEVTGGPVITTAPGRDTLTYTVADRAGNSTSVKRIIIITPPDTGEDKTPPNLVLKGSLSMEIAVGSVYTEPGWTAIDNRDGDISDKVVVTELFGKPLPIVTSSPTTYNLVYTVSDKAGNKAEVSREVKIVGTSTDKTPPVIRLEGAVRCTVDLGKNFVDPGATATDDMDGVITDKITKVYKNAAGATVPATVFSPAKDTGRYTITYSVSDKAGNAATPVVRNVYVRDTFIDPSNLLAKYGVPLAAALPTINKEYKTVTTDGTGAPNMSTVTAFTINWDLPNKGLYQFSFTLSAAPHYVNMSPTHTFGSSSPGFTLTGSGITGLDGEYYIKASTTECVWVRKDGKFAIIFK